MSIRIDILIGAVFGRLTVLSREQNRGSHRAWLCICICGGSIVVRSTHLKSGRVRSCGCLQRDVARNSIKAAQAQVRLPAGVAAMNVVFGYYKLNARNRSISFTIDFNTFRELISSDCHYCGAGPRMTAGNNRSTGPCLATGLDRVDNSKGYTLSNCVPCCKTCNQAKHTLGYHEFLSWVAKVYEHSSNASVLKVV